MFRVGFGPTCKILNACDVGLYTGRILASAVDHRLSIRARVFLVSPYILDEGCREECLGKVG